MNHKFDLALALLVITAIGLIDNFLIKESRADPEPMVWIEVGSRPVAFVEGRPNRNLANSVESHGFWIDRNDVTQEDYEQFVADTGHIILPESDSAATSARTNEELGVNRLIRAEQWNHSPAAAVSRDPIFLYSCYL
jgi:formylglycine-generating enzyme required for sulfatase activity